MKNLTKLVKDKFVKNENANLFDTREYVLKVFISVLLAVGITSLDNPVSNYIGIDMISLLFGMMLTLEPVNTSGFKSGLGQIKASIIGACITGLVLCILPEVGEPATQYSILAIALGITLTAYVTIMINFREMMVVAVFTAIYMTQFVQTNAAGYPSEVHTLALRLAALGAGVVIAMIVNFVFSLFGYRKITNKRVFYILKDLHTKLNNIRIAMNNKDKEEVAKVMRELPVLFNTIDWILGTLQDMKVDQKNVRIAYKGMDIDKAIRSCIILRDLTHLTYDLCYRIYRDETEYFSEEFTSSFSERVGYIETMKELVKNEEKLSKARWKEVNNEWINYFSKSLEEFEATI